MSSEFLVHPPPIGRHNPRANFCCRFPADAANAFAMFNGWLHPNRDRGRLARRPTGDALQSPSPGKRGEGEQPRYHRKRWKDREPLQPRSLSPFTGRGTEPAPDPIRG
jgi:hypothetical protein